MKLREATFVRDFAFRKLSVIKTNLKLDCLWIFLYSFKTFGCFINRIIWMGFNII